MKVGAKYKAFLKERKAEVEFLEGTTLAGKTTVGLVKYMTKVYESPQRAHIIAGLDKGVIEKNLINKDHGIAEVFGDYCEYYGNGRGSESIPHILFRTGESDKIIYCLGYDDKKRWQKALGGQYGCLFVDEINIADIDFVREASMRCDYMIATLNPDDPSLPIYKEYINHARPIKKWAKGTPPEILEELTEEEKKGWRHWFFGFDDNVSLTAKKKEKAIRNVPEGTKLWKNKIQGLRGRATGLVFSNFSKDNILTAKEVRERVKSGEIRFKKFSLGIDTAYSSKSPDTIAMMFVGIDSEGNAYALEERVFNNAELKTPLAPSDVVQEIVGFADYCRIAWGNSRYIFIDSADQATLKETDKYKRQHGSIYLFTPSYKDMKVLDRINLQLGWFAKRQFYVLDHLTEHKRELGAYSWQDDKDLPEDRNDHTINACQYAWLPFVKDIGIDKES